jgi:NAD(P)H-hydrate epimerase
MVHGIKHSQAVLSVLQMTEADRLTIEAGVRAETLMENAGRAVVNEITKRWAKCPTTVLCGPGNNGGDGFVVARLLQESGWPVRLALLGSIEKLRGEALQHALRWNSVVEDFNLKVLDGADLVVDAIFGAGLSRQLEGVVLETLEAVSKRKTTVVAVDVPSGIMGDSGESLGAIQADLTVTFFRKKPGHLLFPGRNYCGEVVVADIGISDSVFETIQPSIFENDPCLWIDPFPLPIAADHKYTRGHALITGGYPMTGAARLSALAAARSGAGLTTVAVPEIAFPIYAAALTSIMVRPLADREAFDRLLEDKRFTAFLIGPGAGTGEDTRLRALAILKKGKPTVIDADAITTFQDHRDSLDEAIHGDCVMTPHEGEFRKVFDVDGDKITRARMASKRSGAVVVLKGADTVVAHPAGFSVINSNAPATLATAGSGDVLSGMLLGLLAQGMEPFLAACAAVWLHGEAANRFGIGLVAEDLPNQLPAIYQELAKQK